MKKKTLISALACILLLGVIAYVSAIGKESYKDLKASATGKKPYQDLDASEILSATVRLTPPDKTVRITEIEELAEYLNDIVIYNKDNSYTEYSGQAVTFTLNMADGTQTEIMEYNPFLVIDGIGYKTEYGPCEALNSYANRLLNEKNAAIILKEPPTLDVISDETSCDVLLGTYSWQCPNDDGTTTGGEADAPHPLDCKDLLPPFETTEPIAKLRFSEKPDTILSVRCWSDAHWSNPDADSEEVSIHGDEIELKPGGYIYEVVAEWDREKGNGGGIARYSFYLKAVE